jgi:hypothetical protein
MTNGMPQFVPGAEFAVYGKWNKKQKLYEADAVCGRNIKSRNVIGSAVIDAVALSRGGATMIADGCLLRIASTRGILAIQPPLKDGAAPQAGEWLDYKAVRDKDGAYTVVAAALRQPPLGPRDKNAWQPFVFVAPGPQKPGKLWPAHLQPRWTLPYDQAALERLQRVGQSVIPAWEKALPGGAPDKWSFTFYVVKTRFMEGCISYSNGIILTAARTVSELKEDRQLAAILAGCVAQVLEEETYRSRHKTRMEVAASAALAFTLPEVAIPEAIVGEMNVASSPATETSAQDARVGQTYLAAAGYSAADGAAAWETLNGKHGLPQWQKWPSRIADREYEAESENAPAAAFFPDRATP